MRLQNHVSWFKSKCPSQKERSCYGKEIRKFDEIKIPANTRNAGKYIYIERNKAMIDDSDLLYFTIQILICPLVKQKAAQILHTVMHKSVKRKL